jgi:serine/threonine protein kinase
MIGKTLGKYRIEEQIGAGGMATVFKAYDISTRRYVAVKVLPPQFATDPDLRERFRTESQAIALLEHPHILPIYNAYIPEKPGGDDITYMVMRYFEHGSLADRIKAGSLPFEDIRRILTQTASALDYAHRRGILHRDIKPSNILLDDKGNVYLADFGIAKVMDSPTPFTKSGVMMGTPPYMSPEQYQNSKNIGHATDQYALGITVYEMVTGSVPFHDDNPFALGMRHLNEEPPSPRQFRPDLPESAEEVILKSLAKQPTDRYPSCSAFADDFDKAFSRQPARKSPVPISNIDLNSRTVIPDSKPQLLAPTTGGMGTDTLNRIRKTVMRPTGLGLPLWALVFFGISVIGGLVLLSNSTGGFAFMAAAPTGTSTPTLRLTSTVTPTITPTPSATTSPTLTASATPSATNTETFTPTPTDTATVTVTHTPTATNTDTPTQMATNTPSSTPTETPSATPTATDTPTATATLTNTPTNTATATATAIPPGFAGNPIIENSQWQPVVKTFDKIEMMLVPAGCFMMGSFDGRPNEIPPQNQCFDRPFWIDRTEVTNAQYGSHGYWDGPNRPREQVSWFEARTFCSSRGGHLPREAEWEYAARGPSHLIYPWGDTFDGNNLTYGTNSSGQTENVGFRAGGVSWVGAMDMSGNVYEWTNSLNVPYPYNADDEHENSTDATSDRIMRGGSWMNSGSRDLRGALRVGQAPDATVRSTGFRCARSYSEGDIPDISQMETMHLPTATSTPDIAQAQVLAGVNLRSGPGSNYAKVGSARVDSLLPVIAKAQASDGVMWYLIVDANEAKWISGQFVKIIPDNATVKPAATIPPLP